MRRVRKVARRAVLERREPQQARKERERLRRPTRRTVRLRAERRGAGERHSSTASHSPARLTRSPVMRTSRLTEQMVARSILLQQSLHILTNFQLGH